MGRNLKISEYQYRKALSEGITLNADVEACNGDVKQAIDKTKQNAKNNGIDLKKTNILVPAQSKKKKKIITKKQLQENRLKVLKENSELYSLNDFLNKIK